MFSLKAVGAVGLCLFASTGARAFDIRGLVVGAPITREQLQTVIPTCAVGLMTGRCTGIVSLAGTIGELTAAVDEGALLSLQFTFKPYNFDSLEAALRAKFGKPTSIARTPMQNAYGAQFGEVMEIWRNRAGDRVTLLRYIKPDTGSLSVDSAAQVASESSVKDGPL